MRNEKGFTLIELLVVIGILTILISLILLALNPSKQFGNASDTKRRTDVNAILNAIDQYMTDNGGAIPAQITTTAQDIGNTGADLCSILTPKYLSNLPSDPTTGTPTTGQIAQPCPAAYDTMYQVSKSAANNRITVTSPAANTYSGIAISVTR